MKHFAQKFKAFVTGSRAYGEPREDSDIDLVVLVNPEDAAILREHSEHERKVIFGRLNLVIVETTEIQRFHAWRDTTEHLKTIAPVEREVAKQMLHESGANRGGDYVDEDEDEELADEDFGLKL